MNVQDSASRPVVIFDGDDTLWETERLYDEAREAAKSIVSTTGLDGDAWEALERQLDVANVKQYGFSKIRFPLSCVQAYEQTAQLACVPVDGSVLMQIQAAAEAVFAASAVVLPDVAETLRALSAERRLVLFTQGDRDVQLHRISTSGLEARFTRIEVVGEKSDAALQTLLDALRADPASSWMVGNSLRSDIDPARRCGVKAIWIDAHVWEYERKDVDQTGEGVWRATRIADVIDIISAGERPSGR